MYYDHDDDSFLREIDFESYRADVDWLQGIVDQVLPLTESIELSAYYVDSETAECGVEGGRFDKPYYDVSVDYMFDKIKEVYPEYDWDI